MKKITFILGMIFFVMVVAAEGEEIKFPPNTKMMPAKKVELILNEKEIMQIDYPTRPCVVNDLVNLIPTEKVLIEADIKDGNLVNLRYVEKVEHPEKTIELEFSQNQDRKSPFMILKIRNPFDKGLKYEAGIQYRGKEGFYKTSTIIVNPKLVSFESWPQPLTRILLNNFRLVEHNDSKSPSKNIRTDAPSQPPR